MAYGDNPGKRKPPVKKKPKKKIRTKAPSTTDRTSPNPTPVAKPKKGPPSPQRTGKATRPQPVTRKRNAPPKRTDRTSDAKRTPEQRKRDRAASDKAIREARVKVLRRRSTPLSDRVSVGGTIRTMTGGSTPVKKVKNPSLPGATVEAARQGVALGPTASRYVSGMSTAILRKPGKVTVETAKGLRDAATGIPASAVKFGKDTVEGTKKGDPLRGVKNVASDYAKDAARRYGPLTKPGGEKEFAKRIEKEGAAPELLDAAALATGTGGAVGRGAGAAARKGKLGAKAKDVATNRPKLRESGGEARKQEVSENLIVAGAQRAHDKARRRKSVKRVRRAEERGERADALDVERRSDEVVPLRRGTVTGGVARKQHVRVAKRKGRRLEQQRREQGEQVGRGTNRTIARLSDDERAGFKTAVELGIRDPETGRKVVEKRRSQIKANRENKVAERFIRANYKHVGLDETPEAKEAARDKVIEKFREYRRDGLGVVEAAKKSKAGREVIQALEKNLDKIEIAPTIRVPRVLKKTNDELAHLERLDPDKAFTGKTGKAADTERRRAKRTGADDPAFGEESVLRTTYAKQADLLGVVQREGESTRQWVSRVRKKAKAEGLADPGYFPDQKRPTVRHGDFAVGGTRAIKGPRRRTGALHAEGRADSRPEVLSQGLAKNIKRKHNWNLVADTVDAEAFEWSKGSKGRGMSATRLLDELDTRGIDENTVALWNPGKVADAAAKADTGDVHLDEPEDLSLARAVQEAAPTLADVRRNPEDFKNARFVLIPKGVHDELMSDTRPSGKIARGWEVAKGKQSRILLGTSPKWLQLQVISNAVLAGLSGTGPVDAVKAQVWWRTLKPDEREAIEPYLGVGRFQESVRQPKIGGAANGKILNAYRAFKQTPFFDRPRKVLRGGTVKDLNPLDLLFRVDNAQNNAFRRAVLYNSVKRDAYKRLGQSTGRMMERQRHLEGLFSLGPKEQMRALIKDRDAVEKHAEHLSDFLGDYTTFTAKERRVLGRSVMFYGFLRFSLRFTFWTMPTKHPVISSIVAQLGQLEVQELRKLLGGQTLPYGLGKFYYRQDGRLRSIDMSSANPTMNAATNLKSPNQVVGFLPPIVVAAANQVAGKNLFLDRDLLVEGEDRGRRAGEYGPEERGRVFLNQAFLDLLAPYREWEKAVTRDRPQGDDSILGDRPTQYRDRDKQLGIEREAKRRAGESPVETFAKALTPFASKPERIEEVAEMRSIFKRLEKLEAEEKALKKPGGGGTDDGFYRSERLEKNIEEQNRLRVRVNELQAKGEPAKPKKALLKRPRTLREQLEEKRDELREGGLREELEERLKRGRARQRIQSGG